MWKTANEINFMVLLQAFKHWLPSLHHDEVHVINTAKESLSDCAVNIISYNLAQMMPVQVKKMKFKAVIAVNFY